jgi:glucose-1-phosphate thymidylyltransferase
MKALVLAGGAGTRLRPLSHSIPKQLVPVAGRPVLFHGLDALREIGITEVGIIVNGVGTQIRAAVGDGSEFGMSITYLRQDDPLGLAHCVMIAQDFLAGDDFVMYLGDNIFAGGLLTPMLEFQTFRPAVQLVVTRVADPSQSGVAEVEDGRVVRLEEKPKQPKSDLAVTGAYFFTGEIHEGIRNITPSKRGEWEITDAIQWLVAAGREVRAHIFEGFWKDTGNMGDLLDCNRALLEGLVSDQRGSVDGSSEIVGAVVIGAGARVEGSRIIGPVIVGPGCVIRGSDVGPYTSIGAECTLTDAGLQNSVLLDQVSVHGVRAIEGSLVGRSAHVRRGPLRLVVGDNSRLEVPL